MKNTFNTKRLFVLTGLSAFALTLLLAMLPVSFAIPGIPNQIYGSVTINNNPAPEGTSVTATINGASAGSTTTSGGSYSLIVQDPDNANSGKTVLLFVNGVQAASTVFGNGKITQLDLSATVSSSPAGNTPSGSSSSSSGGGGGGSSTPVTSTNSGVNQSPSASNRTTTTSTPSVCEEQWVCGKWSDCVGGVQTRNCQDAKACGTEKDKPLAAQPCESEKASATSNASTNAEAQQSNSNGSGITGMLVSSKSAQIAGIVILIILAAYVMYNYFR